MINTTILLIKKLQTSNLISPYIENTCFNSTNKVLLALLSHKRQNKSKSLFKFNISPNQNKVLPVSFTSLS